MSSLKYWTPQGPTWLIVLKVIARILAILLGLFMVVPAAMVSMDAGTPLQLTQTHALLTACLVTILSGVFGNMFLFVLGVLSFVVGFKTQVIWVLNAYMYGVIPVVSLIILALQFKFIDIQRRKISCCDRDQVDDSSYSPEENLLPGEPKHVSSDADESV